MKFELARFAQSTLIAAVLVALPLGAGALVPKSPLITLGQTGPGAQAGLEQSADAKMMMPNPFSYTYLAGANLDDKSGTGHVFELQLIGQPQDVLKTVAKAMGLTGEVYEPEYSTKEYPAFAIGSKDGTGESVNIYFSGTGNWWYNNPSAYPAPECQDWALAEDGSKYCQTYVEQKATPELLPTKEEMAATAVEIFNATGLMVQNADIKTFASEWGGTAFASMQIGNQESPIEWSVSWSPNGMISSVSGHSVKPIDRGVFTTISAKAAVSRMSDWRYSGQLAQSTWQKYQPVDGGRAIAYDDALGNESQPETTPKVIDITVNKSETAQLMIWDKQGNAWLVPGHILIADEGWITPVFSLEYGVIELPEPVEISPMVK